jgi:CheY-like chemotaxis protein
MGQLQKVLVVDDEADIRHMTAELLTECGLAVVAAESAVDALQYLNEHASEVAAVFTDVAMAGEIDGADLAHIIAHSWPDIAVIVTSGVCSPTLPGSTHFLPKPWRFTDVLVRLNKVLPAHVH